jgi:hypothetical protein
MEKVNTGGMISFEYPKGYNPRLSQEEKLEFAEAYRKSEERKRKENFYFNLFIIIILLIGLVIFWKFFH